MLSLTENVVEVFGFKHVRKDAASIQVIFLCSIWSELFYQILQNKLLLIPDFFLNLSLEVMILDAKEFVQQLCD
jgi:hypothetical protein